MFVLAWLVVGMLTLVGSLYYEWQHVAKDQTFSHHQEDPLLLTLSCGGCIVLLGPMILFVSAVAWAHTRWEDRKPKKTGTTAEP